MSGYWDSCVECGVHILTLDNIRNHRVVDASLLAEKYMPPGGCKCDGSISALNPECPVDFPPEQRCRKHPPNLHGNFTFEPDGQLKLQLKERAE